MGLALPHLPVYAPDLYQINLPVKTRKMGTNAILTCFLSTRLITKISTYFKNLHYLDHLGQHTVPRCARRDLK